MCQTRYEIYDHTLGDEKEYEDGEIETFWYASKSSDAQRQAHAKAIVFATTYSQKHQGHRVSISDWYCGGPGDYEYFENGFSLPKRPKVGMRESNYGKPDLPKRYKFGSQMRAVRVGQKQTKQRNELLDMVNQIESIVLAHDDTCRCEVCNIFRLHLRDDKAKIDAELAGYRLYTKEDASSLDSDLKELEAKLEAYRTWLSFISENFASLQVEGFAKDVKQDLDKMLDLTKDKETEN